MYFVMVANTREPGLGGLIKNPTKPLLPFSHNRKTGGFTPVSEAILCLLSIYVAVFLGIFH